MLITLARLAAAIADTFLGTPVPAHLAHNPLFYGRPNLEKPPRL